MTEAATVHSSAPGRKPRARAGSRKSPRKSPARKPPSGLAAKQARALRAMLSGVSKDASRAGAKIARLTKDGAGAARKALGKAGAASRRAVQSSVREWKKLDTPRKVEFVAALLSALAAASGTVARSRKSRKKKGLRKRARSLIRKTLG